MKTQADFRNSLGDDISWKSLYAVQEKLYPTREDAIVASIIWCGHIDVEKLCQLLQRHH